MRHSIRRLWPHESGGVVIYIALLLPVLIGGAAVGVDAARLYSLQTSLQQGADALALAAAAELDRRPSALERADNAIATLVANKQRFEIDGIADVSVSQVRYLDKLPGHDASPITSGYATTDPRLARFVEVKVVPGTIRTMFPLEMLGGDNLATAGATSVGGFDTAVCNFTPMFMCNPFEGTGTSIFEAAKDPEMRRRLIALRQQGGESAHLGPGNYGFLLTENTQGANALRDMLGLARPPACFLQSGVLLRPGFIATARDAINVRFDMYDGPMNSKKSDPAYRPARTVRKGLSGNPACNPSTTEDNQALPRDACFEDGSCPHMDGRMGDGDWDCAQYWAVNFDGHPPPRNCNGMTPPSRFEVYRYEIDNGLIGHPSLGGETGEPRCYNGGVLNDEPDRRILYGAVLNCLEYAGDMAGASGDPIPVEAFAKFFLTEPVGDGGDQDIYAELVDIIEPGNSPPDVVRDLVQLYR